MKKLVFNYIFHLLLDIIIIIFNFFLVNKIIWINTIFYYLYLYTTFFEIIYFIVPIVSLIILILKILTKKRIKYLKITNIVFCIIIIIVGLFLLLILMMNLLESTEFYKECPFNLPTNNIIQNQCENKRCILNYKNSNNEFSYEYLCNYNPTKDFKEEGNNHNTSNYKIICEKFAYNSNNNIFFENEIIYQFIDVCNSLSEYYICQRLSEPKFYKIEEDFVCPNDKYLKILIITSILNIMFNLLLGLVPLGTEIILYDIMLTRDMNNNRTNSSLNSTKNCSKVVKKAEETSFKKAPTETIIICTESNLNTSKKNKNQNQNINNINIYFNKNINININNITNTETIINSMNELNNNNIDKNIKNNNKRKEHIKNIKYNFESKKRIDKYNDKKDAD